MAAPAHAQAPDDTDTLMSLGYEYRRRIKERVRGFGDLMYQERHDPDARWSTTGGAGPVGRSRSASQINVDPA